MKKFRYINGYFTFGLYKLDCHFTLIDDVIVENSFIDLEDGTFVDIRIFGLTPFEVLNSPYFDIYINDSCIE